MWMDSTVFVSPGEDPSQKGRVSGKKGREESLWSMDPEEAEGGGSTGNS